MTNKRLSWRLADLIDYEFFLDADERQPADLDARDRTLYLEEIAPALPAAPSGPPVPRAERRTILRRWLEARRRQEKLAADLRDPEETLLPGEAFRQVKTAVAVSLVVLGAVIGWTAATAALLYSAGSEPINAFLFFVEFAFAQVVILVGAFAVLAARWWFPDVRIPSLIRFCVRTAAGIAGALWQRHRVRIAGTRRANAEALFGVLRARHTIYRGVVLWSLVQLTQLFAISFNGGVLGAMTARHLFHDLDFGWESTWLDADQVARGVRLVAAPWSWAVRPGFPDARQVSGSQNRKRSSARLDPESLKSWSQFLFGVVICYGLLPRLALLLLAMRAQRSTLARLGFNDGRSALTLNRLLTPNVVTTRQPELDEPAPPSPAVSAVAAPPRPAETAAPPPRPAPPRPAPPRPAPPLRSGFVELPPGKTRAAVPILIVNLTGYPVDARETAAACGRAPAAGQSVLVFDVGTDDLAAEERAYADLSRQAAAALEAEIFALVASWTPPMIASKILLDQLRASVGRERLVCLVLIGRPAPDGTSKPVRPMDRELWVKAIQTRGDAFLSLP